MVSARSITVVASTDCSNAFCLADPDLIVTSLLELRDDVGNSERTNKTEVRAAIEWCLDELCFIRHEGGLVYSVLDGRLKCFSIAVGEVQGGLASMTRFCVFAAIYILKPMRRRFPQVTPIAIADDACFVMEVPDTAARATLAAALRYYGELMHDCHQKTNFNKLVILQHDVMPHEDAAEITLRDVAARLDDFPACPDTGGRSRVERGAIKFNGVGIGFVDVARAAISMQQVEALVERRRILQRFIPTLGAQAAFLYGRMAYSSGAVLNHQARNAEPSITADAFAVAHASQVRLLRDIGRIPPHVLAETGALGTLDDRCVAEAMCLPFSCGGVGWTDPALTAGAAHAAMVVDVMPVLRAIPAVAQHIPAPSLWASCDVPMLVAAASAIAHIAGLPSFATGPPQFAEAWQYVRKRLLSEDGSSVHLDALDQLHGRHMQRVLQGAVYQDIHQALLADVSLSQRTRARLLQTSRPGSSSWLAIDYISVDTSLTDEQFIMSLQRRIGAPVGAILPETRCECHRGTYSRARVPHIPGSERADPLTGLPRGLRHISAREHYDAVHWEHCAGLGVNIRRHDEVMRAVVAMVRLFGRRVEHREVPIGMRPDGTAQFVDAIAYNWTETASSLLIDGSIITAGIHKHLASAATTPDFATKLREAEKFKKKGPLSKAMGSVFVPAVADTHGAFGPALLDLVRKGFGRKLELAGDSVAAKWRVAFERRAAMAAISAAVMRWTHAMFRANASPIAGGAPPPATAPPEAMGR